MIARSHTVAEPRWSPDGRRLAWVDAFAARVDLVVAPADGSEPPAVVSADAPVTPVGAYGGEAFSWCGDDALVYAAADGRLLLVPVAGGPPRPLTRDGRAAAPAVAPDGTRVAFALERDDACDIAVIPTDGSAWPVRVSRGADYAWDPAWSPDGRALAWHEWDLPNMPWDGSRVVVADLADDSEPAVVAGGDDESVGQPRFAPDGSALAYVSDRSGWTNVWVASASGADAHPLREDPHEHAEPSWGPGQRSYAWSPDATAIALCRNQCGFGQLVDVRVETGAVEELADGWHHGLEWGRRGLVCVRSSSRTPQSVVVPLEAAPRVVARGPVGGFEAAALRDPQPVTWSARDGATVYGLWWEPEHSALGPGTRPPLLVLVHGGPTGQFTAAWVPRVAYWLDRGWAVLAPNTRGSTGYGREYAQALAGEWGRRDVDDTAAGIRHAAAEGWCDPARVAVLGGSAGGLTVLLLAARHGDRIRAAVSLYGVTDLFDLAATTHRFESRYLDRVVGVLPGDADRYRERSPVTHASSITIPVLLLQGADDKVVPPAQAQLMADAMRRGGAPVEHHVYAGEGHGWTRPETVADELARVEQFLTKWVLRR